MITLAIVAQVAGELVSQNHSLFVAYGPLGAITAWFMLRGEKFIGEFRNLSGRIDIMSRAILVDVVSRDYAPAKAKEQAQEILRELDKK
jgi:hypothetical protein